MKKKIKKYLEIMQSKRNPDAWSKTQSEFYIADISAFEKGGLKRLKAQGYVVEPWGWMKVIVYKPNKPIDPISAKC